MSEVEVGPPPKTKPELFWNYLDALVLAGLSVPLMLLSVGLVGVPTWLLGWKPPARALPLLISQFLFYVLWLACLYIWLKAHYNRPFWRSLAWVRPERGWVNCFAWGVVTAFGVVLLGGLLRPPQVDMPLTDLLRDRASLIWVGGFAITLGPLWEELAFRGFLMPLLVRTLTAAPAILATALVFAGLHGFEYAWSWKHLTLITVAGAAFGWMRHHTGSTAAATVMHAGYNVVFFLGMLVPRPQP